jgi:hypothetical protein
MSLKTYSGISFSGAVSLCDVIPLSYREKVKYLRRAKEQRNYGDSVWKSYAVSVVLGPRNCVFADVVDYSQLSSRLCFGLAHPATVFSLT